MRINGLKPSSQSRTKVNYENLRIQLSNQGYDAIVVKKSKGKASHAFLFRGGNYENNLYDDLFDPQRGIADYPSNPEIREKKEEFFVWLLDHE